jgi:hypothetical protein
MIISDHSCKISIGFLFLFLFPLLVCLFWKLSISFGGWEPGERLRRCCWYGHHADDGEGVSDAHQERQLREVGEHAIAGEYQPCAAEEEDTQGQDSRQSGNDLSPLLNFEFSCFGTWSFEIMLRSVASIGEVVDICCRVGSRVDLNDFQILC